MTRPELCVGAVALEGGRLLMIRRGRGIGVGRWSLPGGRVEGGETMAEAVVRELAEETGLEGVCGSLVGWAELIGDDHHFVVADFAVTILDDRAPVAGDDAAEATWVAVEEVADLDLTAGLAEWLAEHGVISTFT